MPRILVYGAGAVGSLLAYQLALVPANEVYVIARPEHVQAIRTKGLLVHLYGGETITCKNLSAHEKMFATLAPDLIIITTKTYQIQGALEEIQKSMRQMPPCVLLMNGLGLTAIAQGVVPQGSFIRGLAFTPAKFEPGQVWSTGGNMAYMFPEDNRGLLHKLFPKTTQVTFAKDFEVHEWKKALLNAVMNPVAGLVIGTVGTVLRNDGLYAILKGLIAEFREVATARGLHLGPLDELVQFCDSVANRDPSHYPSLSQDLRKGKKTEIDSINGYIIQEGARLHVSTPLHDAISHLIHHVERQAIQDRSRKPIKTLEVTVEPANIEDLPMILALQRVAYWEEASIYGDFTIPPLFETWEEIYRQFSQVAFLKAVEAGRMVGSVRVRLEGETAYIGRLIVDPNAQNRGVGSALLTAAEQRFPRATRYELFTGAKSDRPLHLYQSRGFKIFKTEVVNPRLTLLYLEKKNSAK